MKISRLKAGFDYDHSQHRPLPESSFEATGPFLADHQWTLRNDICSQP